MLIFFYNDISQSIIYLVFTMDQAVQLCTLYTFSSLIGISFVKGNFIIVANLQMSKLRSKVMWLVSGRVWTHTPVF